MIHGWYGFSKNPIRVVSEIEGNSVLLERKDKGGLLGNDGFRCGIDVLEDKGYSVWELAPQD